jgi:hypothetical protein
MLYYKEIRLIKLREFLIALSILFKYITKQIYKLYAF